MKKSVFRVVSLILVFSILLTAFPAFSAFAADNGPGKYTVNVSTTLNMRSGPGTNYSQIAEIKRDTVVLVTETSNGWGKIEYAGKTGWISLDYAIYVADVNGRETVSDQRSEIVKMALGELGYKEGKNNYTKYGVWYSSVTKNAPWCAIFVCWCAYQVGVPESIIPRFSFCYNGITLFKNMGVWMGKENYAPIQGDIIFFRSDSASSASDHVGIVTGCDGTNVFTIEGNSSDAVSERKYKLEDKYIVGYASPNYKTAVPAVITTRSSTSTTITTTEASATSTTIPSETGSSDITTVTSTTTKPTAAEAPKPVGKVSVTGNIVNVRISADPTSERIAMLKKSNECDYFGTEKDKNGNIWYKINVNGVTGYVEGSYVKAAGQEETSDTSSTVTTASSTTASSTTTSKSTTTASTTASATNTTKPTTAAKPDGYGFVYVTGSSLYVRAGAGTNYSKLGSVKKGDMLVCIGTSSDSSGRTWYKVEFEDGTGYVSSEFSKNVRSVQVTGDSVNIRTGAGTSNSRLRSASRGDTFEILGTAKDSGGVVWYKIDVSGKTGYITSEYSALI